MSEETVEVFQGMREAKRQRHQEWKRLNIKALQEAGMNWIPTNRGECFIFRCGTFQVDFYPSTGRWRSNGKTHGGHAKRFLEWWQQEIAKL